MAMHSYTAETMSLFKSLGIDLKLATSVQFANLVHASLSDEQKKYINQSSVVSSKIEEQ